MYKFFNDYKLTLIIILTLIFSSIFVEISSFFTHCNDINNDIFRLHILANSNSDYDQNLKLLVRDNILSLDNSIFIDKNISDHNLQLIKNQAQSVLIDNDCFLPVDVQVTNMYFTTRFYENFTLPAGYYDALRITIGDANGDNWWCVLYPPLCLPAVSQNSDNSNNSDNSDNDIYDIIPSHQADIISNGDSYQFKFALYELYSSIFYH